MSLPMKSDSLKQGEEFTKPNGKICFLSSLQTSSPPLEELFGQAGISYLLRRRRRLYPFTNFINLVGEAPATFHPYMKYSIVPPAFMIQCRKIREFWDSVLMLFYAYEDKFTYWSLTRGKDDGVGYIQSSEKEPKIIIIWSNVRIG